MRNHAIRASLVALSVSLAAACSDEAAAPWPGAGDAARDGADALYRDGNTESGPAETGVDAPGLDAGADVGDASDASVDVSLVEVGPGGIVSGEGQSTETTLTLATDGRVATAWIAIDASGSKIGYALSPDGGRSFTSPRTMVDPEGRPYGADPVLAHGPDGSVYLTYLAYRVRQQSPYDMVLYVARSEPGSLEFGVPVAVEKAASSRFDKPWISVTHSGAVLVSYLSEADTAIRVARSVDRGQSWTSNIAVGGLANLAFLCASAGTTRAYMVYCDLETLPGSVMIRLARSEDDGKTFGAAIAVSLETELAAYDDPSCVAKGSDVWVSYGLSRDILSGAQRTMKSHTVRLARSRSAGATIDDRSDVLAESIDAGAPRYRILPQIALDPVTEDIALTYYEGASDDDPNGSFRLVRSSDGAAFLSPESIANVYFTTSRRTQKWLGDYTGIVARGGVVHLAYAVNATGTSQAAYTSRTK